MPKLPNTHTHTRACMHTHTHTHYTLTDVASRLIDGTSLLTVTPLLLVSAVAAAIMEDSPTQGEAEYPDR